ncbi:MAG: ribulose-phosphate 3-epimerase [Proteobacteria bacterium]|jgi:ribulose-phosphate 3-epimerase|nr:ribulose-phosphate 3-epimerase [Pseudomonadota bacterium]
MIISPSLLSANFLNLEQDVLELSKESNLWLHLDVMDGHFVPNLTFGPIVVSKLKNFTKLPLDAHFMVTNPSDHMDWFKDVGLTNFTFHWEAATHHDRLIQKAKELYPSVGISLNPSTSLKVIESYIFEKVDLVLLMSVNPGFGGQSFIEGTIDKVRELAAIRKNKNLSFTIQVDGGVTDKNAQKLISAGADNLVAGSFVFSSGKGNYHQQITKLRNP